MSERADRREDGVESLRSRMDADARFRRVLSGYDPDEVRAYAEDVKRVFTQQAKAAKHEQETLISELNAAKSEIQARNCAIKTLKETLAQRDSQLDAANARLTALIQSARQFESERESFERTRAAAAAAHVSAERVQALEAEAKQLRQTLSQAARFIETWRAERAQLLDENTQLRQKLDCLHGLFQGMMPEQNNGRVYAQPSLQTQTPAAPVREEGRYPPGKGMPQMQPAQIADKLADTFAEAYALINQIRTAGEPAREPAQPKAAQPRMQVLRPNGTTQDYSINGK